MEQVAMTLHEQTVVSFAYRDVNMTRAIVRFLSLPFFFSFPIINVRHCLN